jgi:hypothetical protein
VGNGLQGSLTGSGRLEVVLVGVIVVLAAVLLLGRILRHTNRRRRRGASSYLDTAAAGRGAAGRDDSTGTARYPSSGRGVPQPMAPSFAAPRKGAPRPHRGPTPGRDRPPATASHVPGASGGATTAGDRDPVRSPVLDPVPPLRVEGTVMPSGGEPAQAPPSPAPPPQAPPPDAPRSQASARTAVPANLPPLAVPPSGTTTSPGADGSGRGGRATGDTTGDTTNDSTSDLGDDAPSRAAGDTRDGTPDAG